MRYAAALALERIEPGLGWPAYDSWVVGDSELFYRGEDEDELDWVFATSVSEAGRQLEVGRPVRLFEDDGYVGTWPIRSWDILRDRGFVLSKRPDEAQSRQRMLDLHADRLHIVQNWASRLE